MKSEVHSNSGTANSARPRWMVVDDNELVRNLLSLFLNSFGDVAVYRFRSGSEALAAFQAAPHRWDFVVTDLEMPGLDGIHFAHRLWALAPHLKILLATGSGLITSAEAARAGFCGLLNKPFPLSALQQMLEAAGVINQNQAVHQTHDSVVCVAA